MEMVNILKKKIFLDLVGIISLILLVSYNAGKILELTISNKKNIIQEQKLDIQRGEKALSSYAAIVEKNPFGIRGVKFSIIEKVDKTVNVEPQSLILKGVITLPPGYAFIENKDKVQKLFKKGEDVFGFGLLNNVESKKVVISQSGKLFTLLLEGHVEEDKTSYEVEKFSQKGGGERNFAKEEINKFLEDPREILTDARLLPNLKDGQQRGFIVSEVRPGGFYERLGLLNGDIILRANKIELTSPKDGIKIFNIIRELDRVELDIVRAGRPVTLVYNIN